MQFRGKTSHACSTPARTRSVPLRLASTILIYGRVAPRMANKVLLSERCGRISDLPIAGMLARTCFPAPPSKGTWCSGITPAQHAGGPGFNPQCVHHCHLAPAHPLHNTAPRQMQIAPAGSRTRVTSMGGLYDAATLRAPVASRMHTHRYRLSQAILPSSELSASMAGIFRQKASP